MADAALVQRLRADVAAFNAWRAAHPRSLVAVLSKVTVSGISWPIRAARSGPLTVAVGIAASASFRSNVSACSRHGPRIRLAFRPVPRPVRLTRPNNAVISTASACREWAGDRHRPRAPSGRPPSGGSGWPRCPCRDTTLENRRGLLPGRGRTFRGWTSIAPRCARRGPDLPGPLGLGSILRGPTPCVPDHPRQPGEADRRRPDGRVSTDAEGRG